MKYIYECSDYVFSVLIYLDLKNESKALLLQNNLFN